VYAASGVLALLALSGCGSSGAHHVRTRPAMLYSALLETQPLVRAGPNPPNAKQTRTFCAMMHSLRQFNGDRNMTKDGSAAHTEDGGLAKMEQMLGEMPVPRARRHALSSYLAALKDERLLDERIVPDAGASEEPDVEDAIQQHDFNNAKRGRLAPGLKIPCLV
jgi:hypothetical protein